jgi:hypothetical protein
MLLGLLILYPSFLMAVGVGAEVIRTEGLLHLAWDAQVTDL